MTVAEVVQSMEINGTPFYHDENIWYNNGAAGLKYCKAVATNTEYLTLIDVVATSPLYYSIDGFYYFRGDISSEGLTSKLIKMTAGGTHNYYAAMSPTNCIGSALAPGDGNVYFLTDGNKLMYIQANAPPSAATDFEGLECATTPVTAPGWPASTLYYSTPEGTVRSIGTYRHGRTPGTAVDISAEDKTTEPLLACVDGYLYFTSDKTLHRYALSGSGTHHSLELNHKVVGGVKAFEADFDKCVYYLADDGYLYRLTVDPWPTVAPTTALCTTKMASAPTPGPAGLLFCVGQNTWLYRIPTT
jgi:hypothetical protein